MKGLPLSPKVDLAHLPPCKNNLIPHVGQVKYRLAIYNQPRPKPYDNGQQWVKTEEGFLEPVWSCGPSLPPSLIDLIKKVEEEEEDEEIYYDELLHGDDDDTD